MNTNNPTPCVALVGHIDHGKSSLLDALSGLSTTEKEAGGITQALNVATVTTAEDRTVTLLDTPGHQAFSTLRGQGVCAADIALLVVSAVDGVQEQTVEVYKAIQKNHTPCIVAITKTDAPGANIRKVEQDLASNGILTEKTGGTIPLVEVSAKERRGLDGLLEMIFLLSDMRDADTKSPDGTVLDVFKEPRGGVRVSVRLIGKPLYKGDTVIAGNARATVRVMRNTDGNIITMAQAGDIVHLYGFSEIPDPGKALRVITDKKEVKKLVSTKQSPDMPADMEGEEKIPCIVKTRAAGTVDALKKILTEEKLPFVISPQSGIGDVTENDARTAATTNAFILAFSVSTDTHAKSMIARENITIYTTDVIYDAIEYFKRIYNKRHEQPEQRQISGTAKIIRVFKTNKEGGIYGARIVGDGIFYRQKDVGVTRSGSQITTCFMKTIEQKNIQKETVSGEKTEFAFSSRCPMTLMIGDTIQSSKQ